jgi:hypothetical protein
LSTAWWSSAFGPEKLASVPFGLIGAPLALRSASGFRPCSSGMSTDDWLSAQAARRAEGQGRRG